MRAALPCLFAAGLIASAQTLPLPPRPENAPTGRAFAEQITPLPIEQRDGEILAQILAGNVPDSMRHLVPVTVSGVIDGASNTLTFFVTPDYLGVGTDNDFFRAPM
ncbi:MAG TPA: hypothetical protein VH619_06420, partial [Verrucomicrobiae bacterium]|nr:hypothetical protein [Verrucomicrobiae bacterium]